MKIGIHGGIGDGAYSRFGDARYKKMREHGFECFDFNLTDTEVAPYTLTDKDAEELLLREKSLLEEADVKVSQVHGPWRWPPRDFEETDRAERMEKMKKSVRFCALLGCENWVVHPIMPFGIQDIGTGNEQKTWDMNLEFMTELLQTAKECNVTICLENMPMTKFSLATPGKILEFVKTIDDEHFKICLDTGHVNVFGELSLGEETRRLMPYIRVLHVHDNRFDMDLHLPPYFGTADWADFAAALKETGFDGSFSLETRPPESLPTGIFERMCIEYADIARDIIK